MTASLSERGLSVADDDGRKKRLAELIRENVAPKDPKSVGEVSVNGSRNVIVMRGGKMKIIVHAAHPPEAGTRDPKVRKRSYREQLEDLVLVRVWDLGMTTDQFFALVSKELGKHFAEMKDIADRDLGAAYEIVMKLQRPALDE